MKSGLLIFLFILSFAGCKSRDKIPKNILPQSEMETVLWDMIRADKFLTDFILIKDTSLNKDTASINLYQQIFRIHHISKEKFQQSFAFYRAHPDLLKVILDSLNSRPDNAASGTYHPQPVTDTLPPFRKIKLLPHNRKQRR
jgi:Domain of unknown function (DUF4296)